MPAAQTGTSAASNSDPKPDPHAHPHPHPHAHPHAHPHPHSHPGLTLTLTLTPTPIRYEALLLLLQERRCQRGGARHHPPTSGHGTGTGIEPRAGRQRPSSVPAGSQVPGRSCSATHTCQPRPGQCVIDAPGPSKWHLLIMEPIRLVLLYFAAYLLYKKGGYGGVNEIKARLTLALTLNLSPPLT